MQVEKSNVDISMRTEYAKPGFFFGIQFGKPVKLPNIHRNRNHTNRQNCETTAKNFENQHSKLNTITLATQHLFAKEKKEQFEERSADKLQRVKSERNVNTHSVQIIGTYRLGNVLGRGSFATIRMARSWKGGHYAIKMYNKLRQCDTQKRRNIHREIEILSKLQHPNILQYIQSISNHQRICIVTQYLPSKSLKEWLKQHPNQRAPEDNIRIILMQILDALKYLYQQHVAHRDLKLENIIVSDDLKVKIIDFGFCNYDQQIQYDYCGTPRYMAPEIIARGGYVGHYSDIWATGVLVYKLTTGQFPFKAINDKILFKKICRGDYKIPEGVNPALQNLIHQMLRANYMSRPNAPKLLKDPWFI